MNFLDITNVLKICAMNLKRPKNKLVFLSIHEFYRQIDQSSTRVNKLYYCQRAL